MAVLAIPAIIALGAPAGTTVAAIGIFGTGAIGQALFSAGLMAIDAYASSLLFKPDSVEGPRIGDIQVNGAHEGTAANRFYGNQVRVPGYTVWATPIREIKDTSSGGGKGGTGGQFITYTARRSAAISFGNAALSGLPNGISRVVKVFADGKLYWDGGDPSSTVTLTSSTIVASLIFRQLYTGSIYTILRLVDSSAGIGKFLSPNSVDVSGFTGAEVGNNGTWTVFRSGFSDPDWFVEVYNPATPAYGFLGKAAGDPITITQKNSVQLQTRQPPDFYLGTLDQPIHRLMKEHEIDNVTGDANDLTAMRGRVIMWLDDLLLTDFGNRLPNFEAILEVDPFALNSRGESIRKLCQSAGIPDEMIDVDDVTGTLEGYHSAGITPARMDLQPISMAHQIHARDTGTTLKFEDRASIPQVTIDDSADEFGVSAYGGNAPQPFRITDVEEKKIPVEIDVRFANKDNDHQGSSRRARYDHTPATGVQEISLGNVVLDPDDGQKLAHTLLAQIGSARRSYEGTVSPRFLGTLREGMRIDATNAMGRTHDILVRRLEEGQNGVISFTGNRELPEALTQTWGAEATPLTGSSTGSLTTEALTAAPGVVWHAMDIPPLRDDHRNQPGFYLAAASGDSHRRALGFVLFQSTDSGLSYTHMADLGREAVIGRATTAPASAGIMPEFVDRATTLRVELLDHAAHTLASVTEAEMTAGRNVFLWGDEIISAATCTLISTGIYDLSVMLRGQRDTADEITTHAVGDRIVRLDTQGIHFVPVNHAYLGTTRSLKVVANGGELQDALGVDVTITGRNIMPFAPAQVKGTRDASDNMEISWKRSARTIAQAFDHGDPLDDETEEYRIDIYDGAVFVKTVLGISTNSYNYTAAAQATDGFTVPSDPVTVRVYQRSTVLHWTRYTQATLA